MLIGGNSANKNRAKAKWESMVVVLKDLYCDTFTNQYNKARYLEQSSTD